MRETLYGSGWANRRVLSVLQQNVWQLKWTTLMYFRLSELNWKDGTFLLQNIRIIFFHLETCDCERANIDLIIMDFYEVVNRVNDQMIIQCVIRVDHWVTSIHICLFCSDLYIYMSLFIRWNLEMVKPMNCEWLVHRGKI